MAQGATKYTERFKARMVQRLSPPNGESGASLSRETGIPQSTLSRCDGVDRFWRARTAREIYEQDRMDLPDRETFIRDVNHKEEVLRRDARSRQDLDAARRRAVEQVLLRYRLMEIRGHV